MKEEKLILEVNQMGKIFHVKDNFSHQEYYFLPEKLFKNSELLSLVKDDNNYFIKYIEKNNKILIMEVITNSIKNMISIDRVVDIDQNKLLKLKEHTPEDYAIKYLTMYEVLVKYYLEEEEIYSIHFNSKDVESKFFSGNSLAIKHEISYKEII